MLVRQNITNIKTKKQFIRFHLCLKRSRFPCVPRYCPVQSRGTGKNQDEEIP
jgi:hypothetical protein